MPAAEFLRDVRPQLQRLLVRRARMHPYLVNHVLRTAIQRARLLNLRLQRNQRATKREVLGDGRTNHARHAAARPGELRAMKKPQRVLVLVHETLVPPESTEGYTRAADRRVADRIRRDVVAAGHGP